MFFLGFRTEYYRKKNGTQFYIYTLLKGMDDSECAGFEFFSNFDSANLGRVEYVSPNESGK